MELVEVALWVVHFLAVAAHVALLRELEEGGELLMLPEPLA